MSGFRLGAVAVSSYKTHPPDKPILLSLPSFLDIKMAHTRSRKEPVSPSGISLKRERSSGKKSAPGVANALVAKLAHISQEVPSSSCKSNSASCIITL